MCCLTVGVILAANRRSRYALGTGGDKKPGRSGSGRLSCLRDGDTTVGAVRTSA
jgi:hypothetical protein